MRVFKNRMFSRWAAKEDITEEDLLAALAEIEHGLFEADLGGHVIKKRIAIGAQGKRAGVRTLIACQLGHRAFFLYGFAKNVRSNISHNELVALKKLSKELIGYSNKELTQALNAGTLVEVICHE